MPVPNFKDILKMKSRQDTNKSDSALSFISRRQLALKSQLKGLKCATLPERNVTLGAEKKK